MNLARNSGNLLIATGVLHSIVGFVMGKDILIDIIKSGFVNSVNSEMDRNAIFWFLFTGFIIIIMGKLMQDYLKTNWRLPMSLGVSLLALSVLGCIMMPVSGFWLVVPQAVLVIVSPLKRRHMLF